MKILEESSQLKTLNEIFVNSLESLPPDVENSIYYARLKKMLHPEIINFCKEQTQLKEDLNLFRMNVGQVLSESEIREYLNGLMDKYNGKTNNVGLDYHIEATRIDYAVPVFCVIKRNEIFMKKFVFRFKKPSISSSISNLSTASIPLDTLKKGE